MIVEPKSSYRLLKQAVKDTTVEHHNDLSLTDEIVKRELINHKISEEVGFIHNVYPQTTKVFVKVREDGFDEYGKPMFFNEDYEGPETPEIALLIPLVGFDPTSGESLDALIDRKVKVRVTSDGIALSARLAPIDEGDLPLYGQISPVDLYRAKTHPEGVRVALKLMGYPDATIDTWMHIGTPESVYGDGTDKYVMRIAGEGYWDQAVETDTEMTVRFKNAIDKWADKNLAPMKTKLCHNPIIAFSAR